MTEISRPLLFNQNLLTYLGQRWSGTVGQDQPIKTAFPGWVAAPPRGDSLSAAMTLRLDGLRVLDTAGNPAPFRAFTTANLPSDDESAHGYVIRYVWDRLQHGELVDDGAYQQSVAGASMVTGATAMTEWRTWWDSLQDEWPTSFEEALPDFKRHLATTSKLLTGQAIRKLAAETDLEFDFDGWVAQQLTSIGAGTVEERWLPKIQEGAACWNWALSACEATTVDPNLVMGWLHEPLPEDGPDGSMPQAVRDVVAAGPKLDAKNDLIAVKAAMHADGLAQLGENFDERWHRNPAKRAKIPALARRVFSAILTLNGFTVGGTSGYSVGIEYQPREGVSWEHWWVESGATIVETFPTMQFSYNTTNLRQTDRMQDSSRYEVVTIPVQDLLPRHHAVIRAGMAQYL